MDLFLLLDMERVNPHFISSMMALDAEVGLEAGWLTY